MHVISDFTRKYPLRGCFLGPPGWPEGIFFRGGQTDADGISGAITRILSYKKHEKIFSSCVSYFFRNFT